MRLWEFVDKTVEIVTENDKVIKANVHNYEDDTVNDNNIDSIDFTINGDPTNYSLYENQIKSIKEI